MKSLLPPRTKGWVTETVSGEIVRIAEVEHWVDGTTHVIRSTEFDLCAEGADLTEATRAFVADTYRYLEGLLERQEKGWLSSHEADVLPRLSRRIARIAVLSWRRRRRSRAWRRWIGLGPIPGFA